MYDSEMYGRSVISPFLSYYGNDVIEKEIIDGYEKRVRSIIVEPYQIPLLKEMEKKYGNGYTRTAMTIGYPYGGMTTETKVMLTDYAREQGVDEINVGIYIDAVLSGDMPRCREDLRRVAEAARGRVTVVPVSWVIKLPLEKIDALCEMYIDLGLHAMKTSPGLHHGDMKVEHVDYIYKHFGGSLEIEVAGRCRTREKAEKMAAAGAECFHISQWRRICGGGQDYQYDYVTGKGGYGEYKDRL